jgi:hypothetical protein
VIVAVQDIAGFVQIAQPVIQVLEALLQPGVELFAQDEVALAERGIDSCHQGEDLLPIPLR